MTLHSWTDIFTLYPSSHSYKESSNNHSTITLRFKCIFFKLYSYFFHSLFGFPFAQLSHLIAVYFLWVKGLLFQLLNRQLQLRVWKMWHENLIRLLRFNTNRVYEVSFASVERRKDCVWKGPTISLLPDIKF